MSSMVSFTVSALVICLSKSVVLVTVMASLTGYAYATLQTLPYTLTCHYHKEKEVSKDIISLKDIFFNLDPIFHDLCLRSDEWRQQIGQGSSHRTSYIVATEGG